MTVSYSFYLRFWAINSFMAIATGFALGYMAFYIIPFIFSPISFPILAFFIYQFFIYKYFWGEYRGHFEYAYRERQIQEGANKVIKNCLGMKTFIKVFLDELSAIGIERDEIYIELLGITENEANTEQKFLILMKLAHSSKKEDNYEREISYLEQALEILPRDLVANYRLANSFKKIGKSEEAVESYKAALGNPSLLSDKLKDFISSQIERVKSKGPSKKPPVPGLKYMTY